MYYDERKAGKTQGTDSTTHRVLLELLVHVGEGVVYHAVVRLVRPV